MTFSLCISHTPWVQDRLNAFDAMLGALWLAPAPGVRVSPCPFLLNNTDYRGTDWQVSKVAWALAQWRWSAAQGVTHHVFMTDDLHIAPRFWEILSAMCLHTGELPIGLLSNHPKGPALRRDTGAHWYRTQSWLVGPAYVLPHAFLVGFLAWFESLSFDEQKYRNDDSSANEYVSQIGSYACHPLPTIIEHRGDIDSTVGHGDKYSRERLSWRQEQWPDPVDGWQRVSVPTSIEDMCNDRFWRDATSAPVLTVGDES